MESFQRKHNRRVTNTRVPGKTRPSELFYENVIVLHKIIITVMTAVIIHLFIWQLEGKSKRGERWDCRKRERVRTRKKQERERATEWERNR